MGCERCPLPRECSHGQEAPRYLAKAAAPHARLAYNRYVKGFIAISTLALWLHSQPAHAHIQLVYPPQRLADQKTGPCGRSGSVRGNNVSVFEPGQTITVMWKETVGHPGHFRISFDDDGQDDFVNPAGYGDFYSAPSVLSDDIPDSSCGDVSRAEITLPNIECENCTLQVVQVMYDKEPYGDGNDLYYQCADIALRVGGQSPPPDPSLGADVNDSCGCQASPQAQAQTALWLVLALALGLRRKLAPGRCAR